MLNRIIFFNAALLLYGSTFGRAGEFCPGSSMKYCSDYCCGTPLTPYCCSSCTSSQNTPYCSETNFGAIIGGIFSFIVGVIIISCIVAVCCGCICSHRTGIQRRGRVVNTASSAVTVVNTTTNTYQATQPTGPQGPGGYPPQQYGYPNNPPMPAYYNQKPPGPYPQNQQYPPYQGYQQTQMPPSQMPPSQMPPPYNAAYGPDVK